MASPPHKPKSPRSSQTLPSSPTHSSSSSDFEFTISISPRKLDNNECPADDLFYKGQLLPLHLSPRISMVRTLLLSSSSLSSSTASTTRHSSADSRSSFSTDSSSRPSSAAPDDIENKYFQFKQVQVPLQTQSLLNHNQHKKQSKFSLSRFSSVFRKEHKAAAAAAGNRPDPEPVSGSSVKRMSANAKEMIRKYLKKARPLYEKLSHKPQKMCKSTEAARGENDRGGRKGKEVIQQSFSGNLKCPGNLKYPKRSYVASCPSSMRSSPNHSGVLCRNGMLSSYGGDTNNSSMEELQNAIQGAIAHCKNSMMVSQGNKASGSGEI